MSKQKIEIPLSSSDLEELLHEGAEFEWTFPSNTGEEIDVRLYNEDLEEE